MVVIHAAGSCLHIQLRHEAAECVIFSLTHTHVGGGDDDDDEVSSPSWRRQRRAIGRVAAFFVHTTQIRRKHQLERN